MCCQPNLEVRWNVLITSYWNKDVCIFHSFYTICQQTNLPGVYTSYLGPAAQVWWSVSRHVEERKVSSTADQAPCAAPPCGQVPRTHHWCRALLRWPRADKKSRNTHATCHIATMCHASTKPHAQHAGIPNKLLHLDRRSFPQRQPIPRSRFSRSVMTRTASWRTVSLVNVEDDAPVCKATIWPSSRIASFMSRTRNLASIRFHVSFTGTTGEIEQPHTMLYRSPFLFITFIFIHGGNVVAHRDVWNR